MRVVAVPSLANKSEYAACGVECLSSLLEFDPAAHGLPPFTDRVEGCVPLQPPWALRGCVVKGFGRGSKQLGARGTPMQLQGGLLGLSLWCAALCRVPFQA